MHQISRISRRVAPRLSALVLVLLAGACSSGGGGSLGSGGDASPPPPTPPPPVTPPPTPPPPPPPTPNRAPTAVNDIVEVTNAGVASIDVLANDSDPDGDPLTVTITEQPFVGTAAVNSNNTVRIDGLPPGFRGLTRFAYQVRDPSGLTATANAAVFVDTKSYRLAYVVDEERSGGGDLYLTDFAAPAARVATVLQGALRQATFRAARSGTTLAFTRADPANPAATEELYYVRTTAGANPVRVTLPAGAVVYRSGGHQYALSPDGNWLALVAGGGGTQTLHLLDVRTGGGTPTAVSVAEAPLASSLQFSADSRFIYWFGRASTSTARGALWRVPVDRSAPPTRISAPATADAGIVNYTLLQTQPLVLAGRETTAGANAVVAIDPAQPGTERVLSHSPSGGELIDPTGITISPNEQRITYSAVLDNQRATYVANVSGAPAARLLIARSGDGGAIPAGIRPDNAALLFVRLGAVQNGQAVLRYLEGPLDGAFTETPVAEAAAPFVPPTASIFAGYDGSNDRVVFERGIETPDQLGNEARVAQRSGFGVGSTKLGAEGQFSPLRNYTAIERGAVILGERPPGSTAGLQPVLINTAAPDKPYALSPGVAVGVLGLDFVLVDPAGG
jgi:hypothetical protein